MLISVHIPKTAGTSFQQALKEVYEDRLLLDYDDKPLSGWPRHRFRRVRSRLEVWWQRRDLPRRFDAVHGHFIISKYFCLQTEIRTAAFFRNPVPRVLSQFQFHLRRPLVEHPFSHAIKVNNMPIDQFIRIPRLRHFYRIFLAGMSPERLDFVGLTEAYEESLALFERIFDVQLPRYRLNVNEEPAYDGMISACGGVGAIERIHAENMRYYDLARRRFDRLMREYPA